MVGDMWHCVKPLCPPNELRISCEGARGSRRASSHQYQARRLPPQERALDSCMRWLGGNALCWRGHRQSSAPLADPEVGEKCPDWNPKGQHPWVCWPRPERGSSE